MSTNRRMIACVLAGLLSGREEETLTSGHSEGRSGLEEADNLSGRTADSLSKCHSCKTVLMAYIVYVLHACCQRYAPVAMHMYHSHHQRASCVAGDLMLRLAFYSVYRNNGERSPNSWRSSSLYLACTSSTEILLRFALILLKVNSMLKALTMAKTARPRDNPQPVGYFGASLSKNMYDPMIPPTFPIAIMNATPCARLVGPARLLAFQVLVPGVIG